MAAAGLVPHVVFALALALTAALTFFASRSAESEEERRLQSALNELERRIEARMQAYAAILRSGSALLATHPHIDRVAFKAFVDRLRLYEFYPGVLGVGYAARLTPHELPVAVARMRREGYGAFRVYPEGERPEYHAVLYLEPLDRRKEAALGYDMTTDETRREAMGRARDTGLPAASGLLRLVREVDEEQRPGFLLYVPVYRGGTWPGTVRERRQALQGYVYSPFRAEDVFKDILAGFDPGGLSVVVYHGDSADPSRVLYARPAGGPGGEPVMQGSVGVFGTNWLLEFSSPRGAAWRLEAAMPALLLLFGTATSLLVFFFSRRQWLERERAEQASRRLAQSETERVRLLEAEHAARLEAEQANRAKDDFLATLSHELRTPLNAVMGWTDLLQRGVDAATLQEGLAVIQRNAEAQAKLISDLLDMNRIMAGKVQLERRPTAVVEVLSRALDTVRPAATAKGVNVHAALDPEAGEVLGDAGRLQQVFWNLLNNSVSFTPEGGRIDVSAGRQGNRAVVRVSDTGRGISPEFLPHVFERFRQAEGAPSRSSGGLGLGLAIVHHLVELHGGRVRARSAGEGRGATFVVELPRLLARPASGRGQALPGAGVGDVQRPELLAGVEVLVVDDEPDALEVVRRMLEACGAEVRCARSAAQALEAITRRRPTVLVSDIAMPGKDGYELLRELRRMEKGSARLPAVALTAYASEQDRQRMLDAGFQAYLAKPVNAPELVGTVAGLARNRQKA
jgi:signal transduction histidine kinase/CheY-like chemotaxis protein